MVKPIVLVAVFLCLLVALKVAHTFLYQSSNNAQILFSVAPVSTTSKAKVNKVWLCGTDWNYPVLAESLFGKAGTVWSGKATMKPSEKDVLVHGLGASCPGLFQFPGKVVTMNGEPSVAYPEVLRSGYFWDPVSGNDNHFYLGPWKHPHTNIRATETQSSRTMPVYNVARRSLALKNKDSSLFSDRGMPLRLINTQEFFAIYAATNCKSFRDQAYHSINKLNKEPFHTAGRCPAHTPTIASPYATQRSQLSSNSKLYSHYKFVLCMENQKSKGYITEKLLYAFIGGGIPIYYGTTEVFDVFNEKAFVYYDVDHPQKALDQIVYLNTNTTAYMDMVAQPMLAHGEKTLEDYFSLSDDVGSGILKARILDMMRVLQ